MIDSRDADDIARRVVEFVEALVGDALNDKNSHRRTPAQARFLLERDIKRVLMRVR